MVRLHAVFAVALAFAAAGVGCSDAPHESPLTHSDPSQSPVNRPTTDDAHPRPPGHGSAAITLSYPSASTSHATARIDFQAMTTAGKATNPAAPHARQAIPEARPAETKPAETLPRTAGPTLIAAEPRDSQVKPAAGDSSTASPSRRHQPRHPHTPEAYAAAAAAAVERNGPIFIDWPTPKLALVFTGDLTGYIEPCGCSGLENLKGGLSRRHALLLKFQRDGWPAAAFDLGGQVRRVGVTQSEIKFQQTVKGLIEMGYAAIGFGADDLRMPAAALLGAATETYHDKTAPFTSANIGLFAFDSGATQTYRIVEAAGRKIGVTAVLGESFRKTINNEGVVSRPAEEALAEVVPQLVAARCDILILLSYAPPTETESLVRKFPQFHYAVTTGGADEPPGDIRPIAGTPTGLIEVGKKGQHAIVLGLFNDPQQPVRYQRVALDARFPESPAMKTLLVEYQDQLRLAGRENLGITEKIHPRYDAANPLAARFVGSVSCAKCHADAFSVWKDSGHAHALDTLVELDPPRQYDAECLSCHSVGWDPQNYVPFQTGFSDWQKTPHLAGNGCENCHGPGAAHIAAETGNDPAAHSQMRALVRVSLETVERTSCVKCHDHDNSPNFKFDDYWSKIAH